MQKTQLKTIQMYYLSVLEVRESKTGLTGLKSKYPHSWVPFSLGGGGTAVMLWRRMFPCLFKRLLYAGSFTSVLSDFLRLYGLYHTKLLCPWESPDKNTGVGCRALLQGIFLTQGWNPHLCLLCSLHWQMGSLSLAPPRKPPKMLIAQCAWFLTVVSDSLQSMDYRAPGSSVHGILQARILEWVAIPFSMVSNRPRDQTWVSSIAGRFFTIWATGRLHEFLGPWPFIHLQNQPS